MGHTCTSQPGDGLRRVWDVERLWELSRDLPVKRVPIDRIIDGLDSVGWYGNGQDGRLTIRDVAEHARRINLVAMDYPIILFSKGQLMDGAHRLARAYLLGMQEIDAVQFEEDPEPDEVGPWPDDLSETPQTATSAPS